MFLHIGNNCTVRVRNIIGIFDADTATVSQITKQYLSSNDQKKSVKFASVEIPKSFVLYEDENKQYKIYFSQLSSQALMNRVEEALLL